MSNEETAFLKKVFDSSAIFLSCCSTSSFSTSFMLLLELPLLEKNGLAVFQSNLLSLTKEEFSLLKNFYVPFSMPPAIIFPFFVRS